MNNNELVEKMMVGSVMENREWKYKVEWMMIIDFIYMIYDMYMRCDACKCNIDYRVYKTIASELHSELWTDHTGTGSLWLIGILGRRVNTGYRIHCKASKRWRRRDPTIEPRGERGGRKIMKQKIMAFWFINQKQEILRKMIGFPSSSTSEILIIRYPTAS